MPTVVQQRVSVTPQGCRLRFSVRHRLQNALLRRMRLSSPAQTSACLTEKRILPPTAHGKAHSGVHRLGRAHLSVRPNSKPRSANPRATHPAAWRGGCPTPPGRRDVTEKRSLACLGITHRAFPRLLKPQNVSFRNSRLDCRRHNDAPRPPLDVVSKLTRRGRRGDAWRGVARGQGAAHVNDGLTESCPILRK